MEVINHPDLSFAFDQTAIAEVPIYGTVKNIGVTAQIDRLLVKEDRVIIIDYKSNMEIPHSASLLDGLELCTTHVRSISTEPLTRAAELCDAVPKGACSSKYRD